MPFAARRESEREVLPWSTWARIHMLRMFWGYFWRVASCWEGTMGIVSGGIARWISEKSLTHGNGEFSCNARSDFLSLALGRGI